MRLGILGGTFDPPHLGHTEPSLFALNEKKLDKIIFVPAFHAPYQDKSASTSFEHRFRMTEIAVQEHSRFEISGVEGERGG
ncbi:MAG: nicotinic acid mononucleotide adenylyltransferase, partial [Candidatus Marinimicrobia bacterium]|nr:nicotinic acid mononucleotide adenylyltransferase [Candidatus Neomarinimicrobiota bacterium]